MKPDKTMDSYFYFTGWALIGIAAVYVVLTRIFQANPLEHLPPCVLHAVTGLYCPGCGGTRSVRALLQGKLLLSLFYHPFVLYTAVIGGWFMISQTVERLSIGKLRIGMHFRSIYLWIGLIVVAANFLIKNGVLLFAGIALME